MKRFKKIGPLLRSAVILGALGVTVTGITFASLQSRDATLNNSMISSATADLLIGPTADQTADSMGGFNFTNVEPGAVASAANDRTFYLQNDGTTRLDLKMTISKNLQWPTGVDISKVYLVVTPPFGDPVQKVSLSALYDSYDKGYTPLGWTIDAGTTGLYKIQALIDSDAITDSSAAGITISSLSIIFSGVSHAS